MTKRTASIERKTKETDIKLSLSLDGTGQSDIKTGIGFFDHMLDLFTVHGLFDLTVHVDGDLHVDGHHTVEDVGICLGQAIKASLGELKGITRYASGHFQWMIRYVILPLILVVVHFYRSMHYRINRLVPFKLNWLRNSFDPWFSMPD